MLAYDFEWQMFEKMFRENRFHGCVRKWQSMSHVYNKNLRVLKTSAVDNNQH